MEIVGTKMEGPCQFLQESSTTQPAGNSSNGSDSVRPVALETTPNPLSYWPPPASSLPLINSSKDSNEQVSNADRSTDSSKQEENPSVEESPVQPRILHHNLPPIAGITSYRGVREVQKSQTNTEDTKVIETSLDNANKDKAVNSEIVEVPSSTPERPKTDSNYVFSIPAAVNNKPLVSPRAPTPFVSSPAPIMDTMNCSSPNRTAPSPSNRTVPSPSNRMVPSPSNRTVPSPSNRTVPSPHFVNPSPAPSPSESPRMPSNLPSPSNLHRVLSSSQLHMKLPSPVDGSRIVGSPHSVGHPPSPSQRPFVPNSNIQFNPRTNYTNSPVQNYHPEVNRPENQPPRIPISHAKPPTVSDSQIYPNRQEECNQPPRIPLPHVNLPTMKIEPERINQSSENQICRNPFELPITKPYSYQQEQQHQQHQQHQHHQQHSQHQQHPNNHYSNMPREQQQQQQQHRMTSFYPPGFKPLPVKDKQRTPQPPPLQKVYEQNERRMPNVPEPKPNGPICDASYQNKNFNKVNGNEFPSRKIPEVGYHNAVKQTQQLQQPQQPQEGFAGRFNDKQNGSFNQMNSLSQRFPPVPQSNYDLNRHIYDSMTGGGGRNTQMPMKTPQQFNPQQCKNQSYYMQEDKTKNYIKGAEFGQRAFGHGQYNNLLEKASQDAYQKRPMSAQPSGYPMPQANDHHRPLNQNYTSRVNTTPTAPNRPMQNQQMYPQNFDNKKLMDAKPAGNSHFPSPQVPPVKNKTPTATNVVPVRSKRESPLDLSVKTVRQSADSTAKDDGEYLQNYRNFIQPPRSEVRFPVSQSNEGATGAPKIDFTPNFSGFHTDSVATSSHHKPEPPSLPPVDSFKKYPTGMPTPVVQESKPRPFTSPKYFSPSNLPNQKPPEQTNVRYPEHFRGEPQKRPVDDPLRTHSSQSKIPKIDPWKLAFDQQIEQRLNSARITHQNNQNALNGMDSLKPTPVTSQYPSTYQRHSANQYRGANMYPQPPVQTSATPYNPSYVQQPQCQPATPQTPQEKIQHRDNVGHSPDPEQIIKQISKGVMPDHKLLQDKNVLSILRSSLEEKEAKLMQLREVAKRKEKYKELMSDPNKKPFVPFESANKTQPKPTLPPFGALTLERMCAPPSFPGHRLNLPRPVDTVKIDIEPTQKYFSPAVKNEGEKSGIPSADLSPHDDAQGPPTDLDGLAAFLAARIRTKGELKQVGPALDPGRTGLTQHFKTSDGFGPPATNGSPPKLVRESRLLPPLRRRYFSHTEEEAPTTSGTQPEELPLPPRDPNGIRSSSETSVFDFRESDSESEMPVLERQTLEGMRRDRKTFGSKQNVSTTTPDDVIEAEKPEVIVELDKSHPDPFWDTAFDMFVEQLEKRPPKRSVRKKKVSCRNPFTGSETDESEKVKIEEDKKEEVTVKIEPEDLDKVENIPDGHVKLSSSRLKIYRDEMRLKEEKLEEEEKAKEAEKLKEAKIKKEEIKKEEERGVKTRGKSKAEEKESSSILDYETDVDERDTRSETESTGEDDDDSLSLSGLESESSDSDSSEESSNSNFTSSDDSENETVAKKKQRMQTRLQTRSTRQRQVKGTGMKLRSKPVPLPKATAKPAKKKKKRKDEYYPSGKKKKPSFGDGSDFRPGWEEECYKFKQQLRMPEKLISISRPPKRSSASLPDLDPYRNSPSLDSSDVSMTKKSESNRQETDESDIESGKQKSKTNENSDYVSSLLKSRNCKKAQSGSIINMLVDKYGKGNLKKHKDFKERKSPRILPKATNKPELLPTPSLGIGKENVLKDKKRTGKKKLEETDSYLGYFRRKTVNNFKDAFKQKVGLLPQEFGPVVLKSRTRTQTRDLQKRATLVEVFGDERPASAPPLIREEDTSTDQEKTEKTTEKKKPKVVKKVCGGVVTRGRGKLTRSCRSGLRSTAVLRSNKAVQNSKRHLNAGRKRNMELLRIRAMASKKFSYLVNSSETTAQLPITKKRLKLKSVRRKFRSGFDYIRKKKKLKKDGDSADGSVKEKRLTVRPTSESIEDVQNEIKNWVINKGLGETILHRAARLGYTDVAAYCLEKMDCSPSPRDNAGYTPLHEACSRGHLDIAKLLLMYGASVSESAKGGIRPLHEAAENGFTELIRLLLSYGADPLLETYTGHTALSLVTDEEARRLIQHHLADVQGNVAPVWTFQGPASCFDPIESGYDPLSDPPSPSSVHSDFELEASDVMLPTVYRLTSDKDADKRWVLMRDVLTFTKLKTKEAIMKTLGCNSFKEMKLTEFNEQTKTCSLLGLGDRPPTKASKVILVPYDDKLRQLFGVETVVV